MVVKKKRVIPKYKCPNLYLSVKYKYYLLKLYFMAFFEIHKFELQKCNRKIIHTKN